MIPRSIAIERKNKMTTKNKPNKTGRAKHKYLVIDIDCCYEVFEAADLKELGKYITEARDCGDILLGRVEKVFKISEEWNVDEKKQTVFDFKKED